MTDRSITIGWLGGNCPVQAEGTIGGEPFYFRARYDRWTIAIGSDVFDKPGWFYEEEYPNAGWMTEAEARAFIEDAAQRYFFDK